MVLTRNHRFIVAVLLSAFFFHWMWEMLQMPSYAQMAGLSWREAAPRCALAALGDVGITILIYVAGALVASSFTYAIRARWNVYLGLAIMGIMHSFWIER